MSGLKVVYIRSLVCLERWQSTTTSGTISRSIESQSSGSRVQRLIQQVVELLGSGNRGRLLTTICYVPLNWLDGFDRRKLCLNYQDLDLPINKSRCLAWLVEHGALNARCYNHQVDAVTSTFKTCSAYYFALFCPPQTTHYLACMYENRVGQGSHISN